MSSEHVADAAGHAEAREVNRFETGEVRAEVLVRPQIARFASEVHTLPALYVHAAEHVRARRPIWTWLEPLCCGAGSGVVRMGENGVVREVDEIADLRECAVHQACARAEIG